MQLHFTSNEVVENDVLHVPLRLEHFGLMQGVLIVLCVVCEWILSSCVRVCVVCSHRIVSLCVCDQGIRPGQCSWATCAQRVLREGIRE